MINNYLADQVKVVSARFESCRDELNPITAGSFSNKNDFLLTKILYATAYYGKIFPETSLIKTSLALELLGWATRIGKESQERDGFVDHLLLATDYLYAKAIDQVIDLNEPVIIRLLAKAIADTAADRIRADIEPPHLEHLLLAAYELGKFISKCDESTPVISDILETCKTVAQMSEGTALSRFPR